MNEQKISQLHILTSHAWGGLELYVVSLVKKLLESQEHSAVYCIKNSKVHKQCEKLGIPVFFAYKQSRLSIKDILNVRKILKENNFKVIHSHTSQDVWLCAFVKIIYAIKLIHSFYMAAPRKKGFIYQLIYSQVNAVTSSSQILNNQIKKNYSIPETKLHLLRYGRIKNEAQKNIQEANFIRTLWNTTSSQIVFATFCRLDSAKGVREFAESLRHIPLANQNQLKIWIMGEPTLLYTNKLGEPVYEQQSRQTYEWLKKYAQQSEGKIELIPFQNNLRPYLEAIDVFVLGTYKETYSLSVLDAMGFGVPIIGTNSGGTPEQVKNHERGLLVQPKSAESLAQSILYYLENKDKILVHGLSARNWVEQEHNWKKTLTQLTNLYSKDF